MSFCARTAAALLCSLSLGACTAALDPSETPTTNPLAMITPTASDAVSIDLARWEEIEAALAAEMLPLHPVEDVLCEWEILGESGPDVYVWAVCFGLPPAGRPETYAPRASIPAVISFDEDDIVTVELPAYGSSYADGVRRLFPDEVQDLIFSRAANIADLAAHAVSRRSEPEPPLIVLTATPQP
ncbi:MAG: hypothetical protein JXA97_13365 [Anaerolineales bacterium]|nr:hypothetical protein [Anaerolineales bacterium]